MFMRDDELYNASVGVFYDAPSWKHEDYYTFMLLERMIGQYQLDKNGVAHLNDYTKQYSTMEAHCATMVDMQKGMGMYSPYRDCGLFGTFFHGNEVWTRMMTYSGIFIPASYGNYINQVEVYRARARLYNHHLMFFNSSALKSNT
jgi:mitochondrial-processing peptidase subunit beta